MFKIFNLFKERLGSTPAYLVVAVLWLLPPFATQLNAQEITAQGFWGRTQENSFTLTVTMNVEVDPSDVITSQQLFEQRFWIRLPSLQSAVLRFNDFVEGARLSYQLTMSESRVNDDFLVTAQLRVDANSEDVFIDMQNSSGEIPFEVCVLRAGTAGSQNTSDCLTTITTQTATQRFDAVCDNPTLTGLGDPFRSLNATFSFPASPLLVNGIDSCFGPGPTNQDFVPTTAYVLLVDAASGINTLPAKSFSGGAVDPTAQCNITLGVQGQNCVVCAPDVYLDIPAILASPEVASEQIRIKDVETDENSTAFAGLNLASAYTAFATYEFGLKTSACLTGTPGNDRNAFELLGETETELGGECFVASVAYGTEKHPDLDTLRWFRDSMLMPTGVGRKLVSYYYAYGPEAASWLKDKPRLRQLTKWSLFPVVWAVRSLHWALQKQGSGQQGQ